MSSIDDGGQVGCEMSSIGWHDQLPFVGTAYSRLRKPTVKKSPYCINIREEGKLQKRISINSASILLAPRASQYQQFRLYASRRPCAAHHQPADAPNGRLFMRRTAFNTRMVDHTVGSEPPILRKSCAGRRISAYGVHHLPLAENGSSCAISLQ